MDQPIVFLSQQEFQDLAKAMTSKYRIAIKGRVFRFSGSYDDSKVLVKIILMSKDSSFYYPVEGRMLYKVEELEPSKAALLMIDYIDTYFEEFLLEEEETLFLPIDWTDHNYDAAQFQIKGQVHNKKVEAEADRLLASHGLLDDDHRIDS